MRILHLLASPFFSGPAEVIVHLAEAQRALGHQVTIAIDRKRTTAPAEEPLAPRLRERGLLDESGLVLSVKSSPLELLADLRALHRLDAEVLHAHFTHDHLLARLARRRGVRLVRSLHARRSLRRSLPAADAFTVPTEALLPLLPHGPAVVLPPLVGARFTHAGDVKALRAELGLGGDPIVGMVSTFQPSRRHALGIEAFRRLRQLQPAARLVLIGDGALEPELRAQVARAAIEPAVVFAGYQSGPSFVRWLQALDEVWVLGVGNDEAGRAAAQARACGVRVVAIDEGGLAAFADAVVAQPDVASVLAAATGGARRQVPLPSAAEVARRLETLYAGAAR